MSTEPGVSVKQVAQHPGVAKDTVYRWLPAHLSKCLWKFKGPGCTDSLLCVKVGDAPKPMPLAVLEAKKEAKDPLKGMQQARDAADTPRFDVKYVFSTNGHRYRECQADSAPCNASKENQEIMANNRQYFGQPVYEYTLIQTQEDSYRAACEIVKRQASIDSATFTKKDILAAGARDIQCAAENRRASGAGRMTPIAQ